MLKISKRLLLYIFILSFNFNSRKEKEMTILGHLTFRTKKREKTAEEKEHEMEGNYCRTVSECIKEEKNVEIPHAVNKHATYVLKTIFMHAQNEVCIFTHGFNEAIFNDDDLILEVIKFLKKPEARLKIAYKCPNLVLNGGEFLKSVLNASTKGKVEIWDASKVTRNNHSYFWLNDRYHFARGPQADIANFGNKEVGQVLTSLFIGIIIKSEKVLN